MKRLCAIGLFLLLAGCRHVEPQVRPGPPLHVRWGPPPGLAQLEIAKQERTSRVEYPEREAVEVKEVIRTSQRETYEPLKGGGFRVTAMLMDEDATRNGAPVASAVSLRGVAFVHRVDAEGRFTRTEDLPLTIRDIEARVTSKELRQLLEPLLTPELLAQRLELSWKRRTEGLCNTDLTPGAVTYGVDRQELPTGGPAVSLVRAKVVGATFVGTEAAVELSLTFGGASSKLAREPGALDVAVQLGKDELLTESVEGHGTRFIALGSCQALAEEATIEGAWRLNKAALHGAEPAGFPEKIVFSVRRMARRSSGPEARAAEPMP